MMEYETIVNDEDVSNHYIHMKNKEFPKAPWLSIKWVGLVKLQGKYILRPMHTRMANASNLFIPCLQITWRMPWLPQAAYLKGWNAAFRQLKKVV